MRNQLDKIIVALDPVETNDPLTPILPRASVFEARGPGVRSNQARTFWPYEEPPVAKLKKLVYQLNSDQIIELGHQRLVLITEDIKRSQADSHNALVFFNHLVYGRGLLMAGKPCPKDHRITRHGFFQNIMQGKHVMEWVIDSQTWWRMRHHDLDIQKYSYSESEGEEGPPITWAPPLQ